MGHGLQEFLFWGPLSSALKPRNSASVCLWTSFVDSEKKGLRAFGGLPCCRPAAPPSPLTRVPSLSLLLPSQPMGRTAPTLRTSSTPATLLLLPTALHKPPCSLGAACRSASLKSASCALGSMHTNRRPKTSAPKAPWLGVPFALLSVRSHAAAAVGGQRKRGPQHRAKARY